MRFGQVGEADVAECVPAAADQDRRAVEEEAVDQIGAKERRRYGRAAFDEDVVDIGEGGDVVRGSDYRPVCEAARRSVDRRNSGTRCNSAARCDSGTRCNSAARWGSITRRNSVAPAKAGVSR